MRYAKTVRAEFITRPNRFVASVLLDGEAISVHVKNTGRCKEILVPGAVAVLCDSENPARKYRYDLTAVYKGGTLINIDSQAPNAVFSEYVKKQFPGATVRAECVHGDSRLDFRVDVEDRIIFAEVKGVTLEHDGVCMFPDAPTLRGRKHLRELEACVAEGYEAIAVFVVQMEGMREFVPNSDTDPEFAAALAHAQDSGVNILCLGCDVTEDSMRIAYEIPFTLRRLACPCIRWYRSLAGF